MRTRAVIAALFCCMFAGCHPASRGTDSPARLVVAVPAEPRSLNSLFLEGPSSAMIVPLVYSYLLTTDDRGAIVPDLASEVPTLRNGGISPDGRTIVYHLRRNVVWQDGAPLTARDVVFTQHAIMNPSNNVYSRYGFERVQSISAPDLYTVQIRLRAPFSAILTQFFGPSNNYGVMPEHLLRAHADLNHLPFNAMPVGSGPYEVKEWARGDHVTLVSNPKYFRGRPGIGEIILKFIPDSNTVLDQLRTGEANAYFFSDPAHLSEYAAIPALHVSRAPFAAFGDFVFNSRSAAVSDPQVRHAITAALDFPQIVRNATRGTQSTGDPNRALFGPDTDPAISAPAHNPAAAKQFLSPRHLSLVFAYEAGKAASASVAVQTQAQLGAAGIGVTLRSFSPELFRAPASAGGPLFGGTFQLAFFEIFTTGDADSSWYLGCQSIPPSGFNVSRFCDPVAQRAQESLLRSYDPVVQRRFSSMVQRRAAELEPFVSLWSQNAIYVTPRSMRGFHPSATSPYWNAWQWAL